MSLFDLATSVLDPFGVFTKAVEGTKKAGTWVAEKITNKTKGLDPDVREAAEELVKAWNDEYSEDTGCRAFIFEGVRSEERQEKLVAEGRSQTMQSKHIDGLAVDIWFENADNGRPIAPDDVPRDWYQALGELGEELGFTWGGRWKSLVDMPHFEA